MSIGSNINRILLAKESILKTLLKSGTNVQGVINNYKLPILDTPKRALNLIIKTVNNSNATTVDLTNIDVSKVTSLVNLFRNNTNLININVSNWDTSNITSLSFAFAGMKNIESVDFADWDVSHVTNFFALFDASSKIENIDVSKWNTSSATNMAWMFNNNSLKTLDVSNFNTSNVLDFGRAFSYWDNVCEELNISGLNLERCTSMKNTFLDTAFKVIRCDGLRLPNIDMSTIGLHTSTALTVESIVGLMNALPQTDKGYSFQIGATNIDKLSDEQKAIATDKGWTLI